MLTEKRWFVAEYLSGCREFSNTEEVWMALRERNPVSWATVSLCIKLLRRLGWIEVFDDEDSRKKKYRWIDNA